MRTKPIVSGSFWKKKRGEVVFSSKALRDLDWQSRGFLSRVLRESKRTFKKTVFLSLGRKLTAKICAIDTVDSFDPEQFEKNVKGMKTEKLVVLYENSALREQIETKMSKTKMKHSAPQCEFIEDQV